MSNHEQLCAEARRLVEEAGSRPSGSLAVLLRAQVLATLAVVDLLDELKKAK